MSKVWDKVVEDLQSYSSTKELTIWQKIKGFFNSDCNGDCRQGRNPCTCSRMVNHDNRY